MDAVQAYIRQFPPEVQLKLEELRALIQTNAPQATETINYGIPTFKLNGNLVHFAGYAHHIGFYPGTSAIIHFQAEIRQFKSAKGSVQFPLAAPLPAELIARIVQFRVAEQLSENG